MLAVCGDSGQVACAVGSGTCIAPTEVCDGTQQCLGGTDELNCRKYLLLSVPNMFDTSRWFCSNCQSEQHSQ